MTRLLVSSERRASISSLTIPHLLNIFGLRPSHKVSRLTADGPVTGMKNERFLFGDGIVSVVDDVRCSVCQHMSISSAIVNVGESSVSLTLGAHRPVPAPLYRRTPRHVLCEKLCDSSARSHDRKRIAGLFPLLIMAATPPLGPQGFSAFGYRAKLPFGSQKLVVIRASTLGPDTVGAAANGTIHPSTIIEKRS